ncbi:hypothetical protein F5X99DRAFT_224905 [Biscogniauxia marginata]|nr:hypothetical protein F5X99DRAFT_224905 [Biscogniauxia marginata]
MAASSPHPHQLSPLDKLMPRVYVRQIYCFPSTDPRATEVLGEGLAGTVADVPYLLSGITSSGPRQMDISLSEPYQCLDDLFSCNDLSSSLDYDVLRAGNFSPAAFVVPELFPRDTQPPYPDPAPVFRARASPINGGFLLCVAIHHSTTDITGFGSLLKIWASHCRTGSSRAVGFEPSWLDRRVLLRPFAIPPPPPFPKLLHTLEMGGAAPPRLTGPPVRPADYRTGIFFFAREGLEGLKCAANEHLASRGGISPSWVSTGDVLAALLWSALFTAEQQQQQQGDPSSNSAAAQDSSTSTVDFPVNFRSRALDPPLPRSYLGAAFAMTSARAPRADLLSVARFHESSDPSSYPIAALSTIAAAHRRTVADVDASSVTATLAYLSYLDSFSHHKPPSSSDRADDDDAGEESNPPVVILGPSRRDGISIVSWADQGARELDWGPAVGWCEAVRLARMANRRYPIVLPRIPGAGGGLEVIVCFEKGYMERFTRTWGVEKYAVLRCLS